MKKFDLKFFILQSNVLLLYRETVKFCYKINSPNTRLEMINYIRNEFEMNKSIQDRKQIEYLLAEGRKKFNIFKETYYMTN